MNQATLELANRLLNKALSTDFDAEAAALTERAYRLLADALNEQDGPGSTGQARKRERRHLRDRRSGSGAPRPTVPARTPGAATPSRRAEWIGLAGTGSRIDLRV